jgi:cytochrome c oxidase cbb3-type subunit III
MRRSLILVTLLLPLAVGCEREQRRLQKPPTEAVRYDERNAYAISQGKRLYRWFNCSACHGAGGGGNMGPPLMDSGWRYGHEPQQIFTTIMEGRPNGMPSFRGRVTDEQAWQIVAFVRSLSGQVPNASMSGRNDSLSVGEPEQRRDPLEPRPEKVPSPQ